MLFLLLLVLPLLLAILDPLTGAVITSANRSGSVRGAYEYEYEHKEARVPSTASQAAACLCK